MRQEATSQTETEAGKGGTMFINCEDCGRRISENAKTTHWAEDGRAFCQLCTYAMSTTCYQCGKVEPQWEMFYVADDRAECEDCHAA